MFKRQWDGQEDYTAYRRRKDGTLTVTAAAHYAALHAERFHRSADERCDCGWLSDTPPTAEAVA